jgi:hypothetical protein
MGRPERWWFWVMFWLSKQWCRLPQCWKYRHNNCIMVHYIMIDRRRHDIWEFILPLEEV